MWEWLTWGGGGRDDHQGGQFKNIKGCAAEKGYFHSVNNLIIRHMGGIPVKLRKG